MESFLLLCSHNSFADWLVQFCRLFNTKCVSYNLFFSEKRKLTNIDSKLAQPFTLFNIYSKVSNNKVEITTNFCDIKMALRAKDVIFDINSTLQAFENKKHICPVDPLLRWWVSQSEDSPPSNVQFELRSAHKVFKNHSCPSIYQFSPFNAI